MGFEFFSNAVEAIEEKNEYNRNEIKDNFDIDKRMEYSEKDNFFQGEKSESFDPDARINMVDKVESVNELLQEYVCDLKERALFSDTIKYDNLKVENMEKVSSEKVRELRQEFSEIKKDLIKQWEDTNGKEWPTYDDYVLNDNKIAIRKPGDRYDAHHILSLCFGGINAVENITPMHCNDHYDSKGIHRNDGPWAKLRNEVGGMN